MPLCSMTNLLVFTFNTVESWPPLQHAFKIFTTCQGYEKEAQAVGTNFPAHFLKRGGILTTYFLPSWLQHRGVATGWAGGLEPTYPKDFNFKAKGNIKE